MIKKNKTYFISLVVVMLLLTTSITYAQTNNNVNISYSTELYITDGQSPVWNVSLPNSIINSTAPSGGYILTFSWGANNGSNIMRPGGGAFTPTATFGIRVNGVQYWQAKTPSDSNTQSGDNATFSGASFVSGVTGVWNMESYASLSNTASIRLPAGVTSITSIQLYGFTGSGGSGGDDFILQLNSLVANSCSAGVTAPSLSITNVSVLCPNITTDLSSVTAFNTPSGAVLTWHTAPTANTANKITNTVVGAGTYYAAFYDSVLDCYSTSTAALIVTTTACPTFCYKPGVTDGGTTYPTQHGITSLGRAGSDNGNWPMVRQSAWTVLEAKTKGFVVNRVKFNSSNLPVADDGTTLIITSPVEGMLVYDTTNNCLKLYTSTDGGATFGWYCIGTQTCPD